MDHLFQKNLLAEKHNLEWQLAQANDKIKILEGRLKKLQEEIGGGQGTTPNAPPPKPVPMPGSTEPQPKWPWERPVPMPKPKPKPKPAV